MCEPPTLSKKDWKKSLKENFKFKIIEKPEDIPENALWTTSCSKTKKIKQGVPKDLYQGKTQKIFYKYMEKFNLKYGILSDKYGIHMYNECLPYYDIHPNELSTETKKDLGKVVRQKVKKHGFDKIIFYYNSPLFSQPYFQILYFSQLPIYYTTSIKILQNFRR
ncbi:MAG TPA: hypothetical protein PKZ88_08255 [Methanothermobacter sp.]|nr:hypothetical protein [Methanothermobacter sp.]